MGTMIGMSDAMMPHASHTATLTDNAAHINSPAVLARYGALDAALSL